MEKKEKMALVYGYLVCLVSVVTFIIAVTILINAIMDLGDPRYAMNYRNGPSLASYENYKLDVLKSPESQSAYVPDEETLRAMYQAALDENMGQVKHRANRSLIVSSLLIFITVILFITHWIWLRRLGRRPAG